jgi:hypothetical protein
MDAVSLFADLSFLFLAIINFYCINKNLFYKKKLKKNKLRVLLACTSTPIKKLKTTNLILKNTIFYFKSIECRLLKQMFLY